MTERRQQPWRKVALRNTDGQLERPPLRGGVNPMPSEQIPRVAGRHGKAKLPSIA